MTQINNGLVRVQIIKSTTEKMLTTYKTNGFTWTWTLWLKIKTTEF